MPTQKLALKDDLDLVDKLREFTGLDFVAISVMRSVDFKTSKGVHWTQMSKEEKIDFVEAAYGIAAQECFADLL